MSRCAVCKANFATHTGLDAHVNDAHRAMEFIEIANLFKENNLPVPESVARHVNAAINCGICGLSFDRSDNRQRHEKTVHGSLMHECINCSKKFNRKDILQRHLVSCTAKKGQVGGGIKSEKQKRPKKDDLSSNQTTQNRLIAK